IVRGMERGAVGAVSALATAFPELMSRLVHHPDDILQARVAELRVAVEGLPIPAVLREVLALRAGPTRGDLRAPLRPLTVTERTETAAIAEQADRLLEHPSRAAP